MRAWRLAGRAAIALGVVSLAGGLGATAATAHPLLAANTTDVGPSSAVDSPGMPPEAGVTVPTHPNEAAADVLGLGYEQIIRLNGSNVEIVDPANRGGEVRHSFEAGARQDFPTKRPSAGDPAFNYTTYWGMHRVLALDPGRGASRLAVVGTSIYVSNILAPDNHEKPAGTMLKRYVVSRSGDSIASKLDAERKIEDDYAITALDAYTYRGEEYVAFGLNTDGVRVIRIDQDADPARGGDRMPDFRTVHRDWDNRLGLWDRDMVTAVQLGTDNQGRLLLIAGKITYEHPAIVATDLRVGEKEDDVGHHAYLWENNYRHFDLFELWGNKWEWPELIEFGTVGPQKKPIVAISWPTRNRTSFLFPDSGVTWNWTDGLAPTDAVRFFTTAEGENRIVVNRASAGPILGMGADGSWEFYYDVDADDMQYGVPGYRSWQLIVDNRSRVGATLRPYRGDSRAEGCWMGEKLRHAGRTFPAELKLASGAAEGPFVTAQRLIEQNCWYNHEGVLYAHVAPTDAPEQAQLIKLLGSADGLRPDQEVGAGALTVRTEREGEYGIRLIIEDRNDAPTPVGSPTLTGARLTPAPAPDYKATTSLNDPTRPVFRFTVTDQRWHVPGADELTNVTLPVPTVEASTDQNTWTALGTTTSPLAPTRSETEPTELTLGDSTFYWQTTPGATDYRYFRLTLPDGTTSDTLDTTTLEAPQPTALTSVELVGKAVAGSPLENNAVLRPNGLDQASLQVTLRDQDSRLELDPEQSPELYGRLYYRDSVTQALLTGLSGVDGSQKTTTFTTTPGQFAENQGAGPAPTYAPVHVATGESNLSFQAHFKANAKNAVTHFNSQPVIVRPVTGLLDVKGTAGNGMVVDGCPEGACVLTPPAPNRPVLHGLTGKTVSLQLKSSAIPGTLSLPLVSETEYPEKITLAQSALNYGSNSKVTLDNASSFVTHWPTITTSFVAEGQLVRAENVYIKAKG